MKAILGHPHALVTRETLRTVFAETVGILNSRPLCPSNDDPNDWEPVTTSHLLQQRQGMFLPLGVFEEEDIHSRKQWRTGQLLSNHFWKRWLPEYLPLLHEHTESNDSEGKLEDNLEHLLVTAGDIELQAGMVELIFRLIPCDTRHKRAQEYFSINSVSQAFIEITSPEFEAGCRNFLNTLNQSQQEKQRYHK
ncbi:hypothetical protein ACROYT_G010962 [Oculina patagonica]